jgi:uncharacterized protein (DUF1501 family)
MSITRRSIIRNASLLAAGNLMGLRPFGLLNALAQSSSNYKALVCVFLFGGNDANNMLVPFDATGYANYAKLRGGLALPQNSLRPLATAPNYALHPSLTELQGLFNQKNLALVANVGTLVQPTTRAQYLAHSVQTPVNLFSHPDQQAEWQNAAISTAIATGWAGRMADSINVTYNPSASIPMIASVSGDTLFSNGAATTPTVVSPGNPGNPGCSDGSACAGMELAAQQMVTLSSGVTLIQQDNSITERAYSYAKALSGALASAPALTTSFPTGNALAAQLKQIAQLIQVRASLGLGRQIFFAGIGNFDTHANELSVQANLLTQVSAALNAFYEATGELGVQSEVTTFTMSDFSRTFQPNSGGGSDHAWGSHHMVMGGAVKGGQIYGTFPTLALGGPDDSGSNGRWIPTTAATQYAATMAQWFGVPATQLGAIFPLASNFTSNNLGFLG